MLRLSIHPEGAASRIENLAEWKAHLLHRLRKRQSLRVFEDTTAAEIAGELVADLGVRVGGAGADLRMVFGMVAGGNLNILVDVTGYFTATGP